MAEAKVRVSDGTRIRVMSGSQYEAEVANRPSYLPPLKVLQDSMEAVYENTEGELVREQLSPEQVKSRAQVGESSAATPERIEAWRQQQVGRETEAIAEEENLTTFTNAALPGSQWIQNRLVGKDEAAQARQELSVNSAMELGGNITELLVGTKGLGMGFKGLLGAERAAKLGTTLGLGKGAGVVGRVGRVSGQILAEETHFYTQGIWDRNQEFVAEDWAQNVGVGFLIGGPFIAGSAVRGAGSKVRLAAEKMGGMSGAMSMAGDVLGTARVIGYGGKKMQSKLAKGSATGHIGGRVARKLFKKRPGRVLGATDEAAEQLARNNEARTHIGGVTPEGLERMTPSKRRAYLEKFAEYADGNIDELSEIRYDGMRQAARTMGTKANAVRRQVLGIHKKFKGKGLEVKMSQRATNEAIKEANILLAYVEEAGMSDVKGSIKRGIIDAGADASAIHRAMVEARINARFRRGTSGGADVVDDAIKRFLEDETLFTATQLKKNRAINAAVDETVQVWDDLGDLTIPKNFEDVTVREGIALGKGAGANNRLRDSMETLVEHDMLSADQVRGIETTLVDADDAYLRGTEAYGDMIKINNARKSAAARLQKHIDNPADVPTTQESFAAQKYAMVADTAADLMRLGNLGLDALLSQKSMTVGTRGVVALHQLLVEEKYEIFHQLQSEIPNLTGNPEYAIEKMAKIMDRGAAYDPVGVQQAGEKMTNTLYWLASQMPKPDDTIYGRQVPQPLSLVEEMLEKWVASYDPVSVGFATLEGRVSPGMVDAVRVTAPAMYAEMNAIFADMMGKVPANEANPRVVASIGMFMGGMDPMYTGEFLRQIQTSYAQTSAQSEMSSGGPNNMPNPKQAGQSNFTTSQRQQQ
jgi:hypothetical protein